MFTVGTDEKAAKIFLDKEHIDRETIKQIEAITAHPSVEHVRIMPDAHKGNGCCVGFTCKMTRTILPSLIGGDIGCGIAMHPLPASLLSKKNSLTKLDRIIQRNIPMGNGHDKIHSIEVIQEMQYEKYLKQAQEEALAFSNAFESTFHESIRDHILQYTLEWLKELSRRIGSNYKQDLRAMGTLGGGNHFIEVNEAVDGEGYLTVHTGSRHLGQRIARYHHKKTFPHAEPEEYLQNIPDDADTRGVDLTPRALGGIDACEYYFDMIWAQTYAKMNRRAILSMILADLGMEMNPSSIIESIHNYIDFRDMVIRKGAIRCHAEEQCIVALNMRDGVLICNGKGNSDWNQSGPHGCGRIRARGSSKKGKNVDAAMRKFRLEMGDVYSSCIMPETLDERPSVYRDAAIIESALSPTASLILHAKTVLNVKGH